MPNLMMPETFNEKLLHKMLFDRDHKLTLFADKYLVRDFVRSRLGGDEYLTKLFAVVESSTEIRGLGLPARFVVKPNHLCARIKVVRDPEETSLDELEKLASEWLHTNYFHYYGEWAYKNITPRIIFEELLEDNEEIPPDYKFFCFGGEPRFLYVAKGRFENLRINFYDLNFKLLPVRYHDQENFQGDESAPKNFGRMLEIARRLSSGTDFLRVDLYNIQGRIVFGELTNYPSHAAGRFMPPSWDTRFGSYWK